MLWMLPLLLACSARGAQGIDPAPPWASKQGRAQANTELADALLKSGNPEAALRLIGKMHDGGTKSPALQVIQGKAMARLGLLDDAEAVLTQVARRHPGQADAQNQLGILLMDQKRVDEAIGRFRAATRAAPRDSDSHNNLGFALMAAGRHAEAIKILRKAITLDGSKARTRNNLGFALVATKQDAAALRVFKAGSDVASAHINLALALELRGDLEAAKRSYGSALKANPDHAVATAALKRLQGPPQDNKVKPPDNPRPSGVFSPPVQEKP